MDELYIFYLQHPTLTLLLAITSFVTLKVVIVRLSEDSDDQ